MMKVFLLRLGTRQYVCCHHSHSKLNRRSQPAQKGNTVNTEEEKKEKKKIEEENKKKEIRNKTFTIHKSCVCVHRNSKREM